MMKEKIAYKKFYTIFEAKVGNELLTFSGNIITAKNKKEAELICKEYWPYLKVIGELVETFKKNNN